MTKVQNKIENPNFLKEAGEYLVANGYSNKKNVLTLYFYKGDKGVIIYNDKVDFIVYDDGERDQCKPGYSRYMAFTGISDLDIFKWMLLFHIADIVPMQQFIQAAKKEVPGDVKTMGGWIVQIFDHFQVTGDHNALPVNY